MSGRFPASCRKRFKSSYIVVVSRQWLLLIANCYSLMVKLAVRSVGWLICDLTIETQCRTVVCLTCSRVALFWCERDAVSDIKQYSTRWLRFMPAFYVGEWNSVWFPQYVCVSENIYFLICLPSYGSFTMSTFSEAYKEYVFWRLPQKNVYFFLAYFTA